MYSVYRHFDSAGNCFYVGCTKQKYRPANKYERSRKWKRAAANGRTVEIVASFLDEVSAFELEKFLISEYRSIGVALVNITGGGKGNDQSPSLKARRKISSKLIGKPLSESTKLKMSISRTGRKVSQETRNKIGKANKGMVHSAAFRAAISKRMKGNIPWNKGTSKRNKK